MPQRISHVPSGAAGSVVVRSLTLDEALAVPLSRQTVIEGASEDGAINVRFEVDTKPSLHFVHADDVGEREAVVDVTPLLGARVLFLSGTWNEDEVSVYVGNKEQPGELLHGRSSA